MPDIPAYLGQISQTGGMSTVLGIILLSWLLEDAALILAAALASLGTMDAVTAWAAAFAGILSGDLMVYAGARWLRKPLRVTATLPPPGYRALAVSRFIPGLRTFTYGWSGLSRMPAPPFLAIVAGSGLIWTLLVFGWVLQTGKRAETWLGYTQWLSLPIMLLMLWSHRDTIRGLLARKESMTHEQM